MGEKRTTFSSAQRSNEKWRARRAHMKIRDDANPINIRRIGVSTAFTRIPLLIPLSTPAPPPHPAPFYRPRVMSYESPFKTSRAPALPEIIFHVSWLIQTRSNHHLQKTWRKLEKGEKGRRRANHPLSSFYALLFFPFQAPCTHQPDYTAVLYPIFVLHFATLLLYFFLFSFSLSVTLHFHSNLAFVVFVYLEFIFSFTISCFFTLCILQYLSYCQLIKISLCVCVRVRVR